MLLMQCPVAGFQFHEGEAHWGRMKAHDALTLRREPGNRHDPRAVRVEWRGVALGYLPREANYAVSQMLDGGVAVEAHIRELRFSDDPWKRVMIEVAVPGAIATAPPKDAPAPPVAAPPPVTIAIDACVRTKQPPRLELSPVGGTEDRWHKAIALLESLHPDIARRLALPAAACVRDEARTVTLWNAVEISINATGRNLHVRYLDAFTPKRPPVTIDLKQPIAAYSWKHALLPVLLRECAKQGIDPAILTGSEGRWLHRSLHLTFAKYVDFDALRRKVLEFLVPDPLVLSLTNRIFGNGAPAEKFNWVGEHALPLAQVAIDQPAMLPFLRFLPAEIRSVDPLAMLQEHVLAQGMQPGAWKRLAQWGFATFDDFLDGMPSIPAAFIEYANLLYRLEVQDPPPKLFSSLAGQSAFFDDAPGAARTLRWIPDWFMRALLREACDTDDENHDRLANELAIALAWLRDTKLEPDSNQRKAGWSWIVHRAIEHDVMLEGLKWAVACKAVIDGAYLVVPIRSSAELRAEARAMMNCLETYEAECALGEIIVFSIRRASDRKRLACFTVSRTVGKHRYWQVSQIAGKVNSTAPPELALVAKRAVARLNGDIPA